MEKRTTCTVDQPLVAPIAMINRSVYVSLPKWFCRDSASLAAIREEAV